MPGIRLATVRGLLITTDDHGRFHLPCAALPDRRIGSNLMLKLDTRTLPDGYHVTSENPRVIRLTAGKMSTLNFSVAPMRLVRLDLTEAAFVPGATALLDRWTTGLDRLARALAQEPATLSIVYAATASDALVKARITHLHDEIRRRWGALASPYPLPIETRVERAR